MRQKPVPTPYYHNPPMLFKNFEIHYNRDQNLKQIVTNQHNYYEFYFLISGEIAFYIEGIQYALHPGDIMLIPPKHEHHSVITNTNPYERYVLWLDPDYINRLSSPSSNLSIAFQKDLFGQPHITPTAETRMLIHHLLESLLIASHSKEYGCDLLMNAYIIELLVNLAQFRIFSQPVEQSVFSVSVETYSNPIIRNAIQYINDHIYESISVQEISNSLFISKSYLSKLFSNELNIPLHQFITKKKLFLARQDLLQGVNPKEVVSRYSFGTYSSFFRSFKSEFGKSPKEIKKDNACQMPKLSS